MTTSSDETNDLQIDDEALGGVEGIFDDRFHHVQFAFRLARALLEVDARKGTIVALDGEWGSGKTGIARLASFFLTVGLDGSAREDKPTLEDRLEKYREDNEIDEDKFRERLQLRLGLVHGEEPIERLKELSEMARYSPVLELNAWLNKSPEQVATELREEIASKLPYNFKEASDDEIGIKKLADDVRKYARTVGKFAAESRGTLSKATELFSSPGSKGVHSALGYLSDRINEADRLRLQANMKALIEHQEEQKDGSKRPRVIAFVDDIDRLTAAEVVELIILLRKLVEMDNIVFVLLYDRARVFEALALEMSGPDGPDWNDRIETARVFMEKIVQVSFKIPDPRPRDLIDFLDGELRKWHGQLRDGQGGSTPKPFEDDSAHWSDICETLLEQKLKSPRAVRRLVHLVAFTWQMLPSTDIDLEDFVALQALYLFDPKAYDVLRRPEVLAVLQSEENDVDTILAGLDLDKEDRKVFSDDVSAILNRLFARGRREVQGIAHREYGHLYFSFAPSNDPWVVLQMQATILPGVTKDEIAKKLQSAMQLQDLPSVLRRAGDLLSEEKNPQVLNAWIEALGEIEGQNRLAAVLRQKLQDQTST